jgi:DNA-binding response OmpR family regulator
VHKVPFRALVVDTNREALAAMTEKLASEGYLVSCESEFEAAKQRLAFAPPDVLVTAARLGPFNGLHLVLRAHADWPAMPAIVVDEQRDPVLELEAKKMDAAYLAKPFEQDELSNIVKKLLSGLKERPGSTIERRWPRRPATVSANVGSAVAKVVDVSYGGLRLELPGLPDDGLLSLNAISLPSVGQVPIHPVWAKGGIGRPPVWWCGVEVDPIEPRTAKAWRTFVDSLS